MRDFRIVNKSEAVLSVTQIPEINDFQLLQILLEVVISFGVILNFNCILLQVFNRCDQDSVAYR